MRERAIEYALCAHLEADRDWLVGRQLGGGVASPTGRVLDVVGVEPTGDVADRAALTDRAIPAALVSGDVGVGRFRPWREAAAGPPPTVRRLVDRGVEVGFLEREFRGAREFVRQVARYPAWVDRLVGIEVKPDLSMPGTLERQLQTDVSLGVLDAVVLATQSYVTGAHRNRIPDEVGIWRLADDGTVTVCRPPTPLDLAAPGVEIGECTPGRTDVTIVSAREKRAARIRIAERAFERGWRHFELPGCHHMEPDRQTPTLPVCSEYDRVVDPAVTCEACPDRVPCEPPQVDLVSERAARTAWIPDPPKRTRRQAALDAFD